MNMAAQCEKSVSELVRMALLDLEKDFSKAILETRNNFNNQGYQQGQQVGYNSGYTDGYTKGHNEGMNKWAIWVVCSRCRNRLYIKPDSKKHKEILDFMDNYFYYETCPE